MHFRAVILGFHRSAPIAIIVASSSSPFPLSPLFDVVAIATTPYHPPSIPLFFARYPLFLSRSHSRSVVSFVAPITSWTALIKLVTRISFFSLLVVRYPSSLSASRATDQLVLPFLRFSLGRALDPGCGQR